MKKLMEQLQELGGMELNLGEHPYHSQRDLAIEEAQRTNNKLLMNSLNARWSDVSIGPYLLLACSRWGCVQISERFIGMLAGKWWFEISCSGSGLKMFSGKEAYVTRDETCRRVCQLLASPTMQLVDAWKDAHEF